MYAIFSFSFSESLHARAATWSHCGMLVHDLMTSSIKFINLSSWITAHIGCMEGVPKGEIRAGTRLYVRHAHHVSFHLSKLSWTSIGTWHVRGRSNFFFLIFASFIRVPAFLTHPSRSPCRWLFIILRRSRPMYVSATTHRCAFMLLHACMRYTKAYMYCMHVEHHCVLNSILIFSAPYNHINAPGKTNEKTEGQEFYKQKGSNVWADIHADIPPKEEGRPMLFLFVCFCGWTVSGILQLLQLIFLISRCM